MNNLYNQMGVKTIRDDQSDSFISVKTVTRDFYDRIVKKDPMTIYVIVDTGQVYKGDIPWGGFNPHKNHSRYLTLRKTPSGTEYIIVEYRDNGMIEICSYKDPQDAIDFLDRSIHPLDVASAKREIFKTLLILRELTADLRGISSNKGLRRTGELARSITIIMRIYLKLINEEHIMDDLNQIFKKYPDSAAQTCGIRDESRGEYSTHKSYHAYEQIWIYLRDIRFLRREFQAGDEEYRWVDSVADNIIAILMRIFRDY